MREASSRLMRSGIRRDELEARVLNALRTRLVDPALFATFCEVFTQEVNRLRMDGRAEVAAAEAENEKIDRELSKLLTAIKSGGPIEAIVDDMKRLEARKAELTAFLATADDPPPLLHPSMAQLYRSRVQGLYDALQGEDEETRTEAADIIRTLVEDIVLTPVDGKVEIDVRGDLAGILALSVQTKNPAGVAGSSQVKMVAGARNHRYQHSIEVGV